jgi:hypothetical protein
MQQILTEQQQYFPEWTGNSPGLPASSAAYSDSRFSKFQAHSTAVTPVGFTDEPATPTEWH